ncbi:MAG: SpoIIIAH-like family protein [Clostridia bacterium]|nr:SpoIIIAH-like family protein [Clostridia bacterium]
MKRLFKSKKLMALALVTALGLAVYLNYAMSSAPTAPVDTEPSAPEVGENLGDATFVGAQVSEPDDKPEAEALSFFEQARENRVASREEALSILQEVLDSATASAADKKSATDRATAIAQNVLQESNIESLIEAKGFADSVVYIDGENCSVVVQTEELSPQESVQIMEIVLSQSSVKADKIQIMVNKT